MFWWSPDDYLAWICDEPITILCLSYLLHENYMLYVFVLMFLVLLSLSFCITILVCRITSWVYNLVGWLSLAWICDENITILCLCYLLHDNCILHVLYHWWKLFWYVMSSFHLFRRKLTRPIDPIKILLLCVNSMLSKWTLETRTREQWQLEVSI